MSNQIETIIDIQRENRNKKTVFWRPILVLPAIAFLCSFTQMSDSAWAAGFIVAPVLLALIFRGIYPSYALHFNHALSELSTRVLAYLLFLTDEYPTIERNQKIAIVFPDVQGGARLNRWMPIVKWFLAIPLYIVGAIYAVAAAFVTIAAWITTWSTGKYPSWAVEIVMGTIRFWNRVNGYALLLVTDEYPSFSL